MDIANRLNFQGPFLPKPVPRYRLSQAKTARVNFASVLYQPADELFGPCAPIENLKSQIAKVNWALKKGGYRLAKTPVELGAAVDDGQLAAFHCLEGGFSVDAPESIGGLAEWGVAYITLAHLVFRGISTSVNAFPFLSDAEYERMLPMPQCGLTELGKDICREMCRVGIVPDITHATPAAVDDIFEIAQANRPSRAVIVSHGAPQGATKTEYKLNLCEDLIRRICRSGGVIGVIFFDHWLLPVGAPNNTRTSIQTVIDAVYRIKQVAGTTDCIAIGSDLDGFIEPVAGLENVGKFRDLEKGLREHFEDDIVQGILWRNAFNTLRRGWAS